MREWTILWREMNDSQMTGELESNIVPKYSTCGAIQFTSCDDHHVVFARGNKTNAELSLSCLPRKEIVDMEDDMQVHEDALLPAGF